MRKVTYIILGCIIIGLLAASGCQGRPSVEPYVIEGYSSGTNYDGSAMGVILQEVGGENISEGFVIAGARWREFGGPWHDSGTPPSMAWPSYGQHIRIGVIDYKPVDGAPGGSAVVWLEVIDIDHMVKE